MPGLMLHKLSKPHSKNLNGRAFSIHDILGPCTNGLLSFPLFVEPYEGEKNNKKTMWKALDGNYTLFIDNKQVDLIS